MCDDRLRVRVPGSQNFTSSRVVLKPPASEKPGVRGDVGNDGSQVPPGTVALNQHVDSTLRRSVRRRCGGADRRQCPPQQSLQLLRPLPPCPHPLLSQPERTPSALVALLKPTSSAGRERAPGAAFLVANCRVHSLRGEGIRPQTLGGSESLREGPGVGVGGRGAWYTGQALRGAVLEGAHVATARHSPAARGGGDTRTPRTPQHRSSALVLFLGWPTQYGARPSASESSCRSSGKSELKLPGGGGARSQ